MKRVHYLLGILLLAGYTNQVCAQVSNDNEDEVNKVDQHYARAFVPGQVLVKFKDDSNIRVQKNAKGCFRAASINSIDELLKQYGVEVMENLYPAAKAKSESQLRSRRAPNGTIVKERNLDKLFLLKMGEDKPVIELVNQLKEMSEVEYAEPNYKVYITADMPSSMVTEVPSQQTDMRRAPVNVETTASVICSNPSQNPLYFRQYGITQQNIHKLWNKPIINKKRPVIAVLDTGVDINHPDLKDNIWTNSIEVEGEAAYDDDTNGIVDDKYGWNFVDNYYDLTDRYGHGTHVAGIAAASDNKLGIVGANPLALIMPVKVINDRGEGDIATICRGIAYAAENGADVINMSFGSSILSNSLKEALDNAYQTGTVLVASAGNNGKNIYDNSNPLLPGTIYPAAYYLVLGVEASGSNLQRASYSNYDPDGPIFSEDGIDGRNYEIQVPGDKIYSTLPGGKYNQLSGTSMSAPLLAGAISALQMVKDYPSKEVLFGDIIYFKVNFEKIYNDDEPRTPKIDLVSLNIDDNVEGNTNIDGQVDVGETINFSPVLRNTWADATDINLRLTVDPIYANYVEIENPEVPFGYSISAYGRSAAKTPITVIFSNEIGDNTRIKFVLTVSCAEGAESFTQDVYVTVNNMVKISGLISEDRTLTADHVYYVNDNLGIMEGATLTIEPGTRLEFAEGFGISSYGKLVANGTPENPIVFIGHNGAKWAGVESHVITTEIPITQYIGDTISFCRIEGFNVNISVLYPYMKDCLVIPSARDANRLFQGLYGERNTITGATDNVYGYSINEQRYHNDSYLLKYSNIVNNVFGLEYSNYAAHLPNYSQLIKNNYFNNYATCAESGKYFGKDYCLANNTSTPGIDKSDNPSYLGTSREDIVRPYVYEIGNAPGTYGQIDLSNMRTTPIAEAHGIVWKVCVNGKDAQDEYEDLAPLGVGKHKFEVYFNRPMNKNVAPLISFGVREPYTQNAVAEDGSWNEEGTIYTAYKTITGKTKSDGINRIYVYGAEDNEFFEIPYEKTRFNIQVQAAGSMATGFAAEAGLGRVNLTWNNENNNFEDAMGFNIYRYTIDTEGKADSIRINQEIIDIETTSYTDYEVTPGETYYYMYKVLSTDLQEYDVSNIVAATPLTSTLGDANGSGDVDVADVITTVNYAAGMEPKPFIFEAADMNTDQTIDILDVVGIIQKILNPSSAPAMAMVENRAIYTIEDGVLYVESPVALAGVQVQLNMDVKKDITVLEDLNGFEHTSAWLSDNDYLFLAYNLNGKTLSAGKHALLNIGDAEISSIRLSNAMGGNVNVEGGEGTTRIDTMGSKIQLQGGVFNLKGQKVAADASDLKKLPKGVYIVNGKKVIK